MRETDDRADQLISYVDSESRVRGDHPLRVIREIANEALLTLASDFSTLVARCGRPSIPPERLLPAMLLQAYYSVRCECQLMERLDTDFLYRWYVGLNIDGAVCHATVYSRTATAQSMAR
jgi:transposase